VDDFIKGLTQRISSQSTTRRGFSRWLTRAGIAASAVGFELAGVPGAVSPAFAAGTTTLPPGIRPYYNGHLILPAGDQHPRPASKRSVSVGVQPLDVSCCACSDPSNPCYGATGSCCGSMQYPQGNSYWADCFSSCCSPCQLCANCPWCSSQQWLVQPYAYLCCNDNQIHTGAVDTGNRGCVLNGNCC